MARRPVITKKSAMADAPKVTAKIAKLAYSYFAERGCQHGHDFDDWLKAERKIKGR